jgi:hypothetical protein
MVSESLEREVRAAFGEQWQQALAELHTYGREPYEREHDRVRRAILTLADGDLTRLQHFTERARQDYRDVLMWAEYPEASKDVSEEDVRALLNKWGRSEGG